MRSGRSYRAVSLDLWFTTLIHDARADALWRADRVELLRSLLRPPNRSEIPRPDIETAMEAVDRDLRAAGAVRMAVDPAVLLDGYARALRATLTVPLAEAAERFSAAGMSEHPPVLNPEAPAVLGELNARGIPVVAITNTARRGSSWKEFLNGRLGLGFRDVIASAEVGAAKPSPEIFFTAARRLGVPAEQILHVGDRWELDVVGARAAGCGAVLYCGLWDRYPPGLYSPTDPELLRGGAVCRIDRLEEILEFDLRREA